MQRLRHLCKLFICSFLPSFTYSFILRTSCLSCNTLSDSMLCTLAPQATCCMTLHKQQKNRMPSCIIDQAHFNATISQFTQAHASKLAKDPEAPDNRFKGFDEFMASAKAQAATKTEPAPETQVMAQAEEEDQPYSPSQGVGSDADPDQPDLVNLIASSGSLPRKEVGLMSSSQAGLMCCT